MKNILLDNAVYDGYNGDGNVVERKERQAYADKELTAEADIQINHFMPLTAGWHEITIRAVGLRTFESGAQMPYVVFTLDEDETQYRHVRTLRTVALSLLRDAKGLPRQCKAKDLTGPIVALFTEYVPENQTVLENRVFLNLDAFRATMPEEL